MGGSLLASGVTPAYGSVSLLWSGSCSVYVTVTEPSGRFTAYGQSLSLTANGSTTVTMTPASGYHCLGGYMTGCVYPEPDTLHFSDTLFGNSGTMTYDSGSGNWVSGQYPYTWPADACSTTCPAASGYVIYHWNGGMAVTFTYHDAIDGFHGCPDTSSSYAWTPYQIFIGQDQLLSPTSSSCYLPGSSAFNYSFTGIGWDYASNPTFVRSPYCQGTATFTVTE